MVRLSDAMDRMLEEAWTRPIPARIEREIRLPLDVYTTPSEIVISANVPGLKPDDVEITLEGDTLAIKGEFKAPMENVDSVDPIFMSAALPARQSDGHTHTVAPVPAG
jgi:HSP20 family protein